MTSSPRRHIVPAMARRDFGCALDTAKLKAERDRRGISCAAAAELAGMRYKQAWFRLEQGDGLSLTLKVLNRMAEALEVPAKDLLAGGGPTVGSAGRSMGRRRYTCTFDTARLRAEREQRGLSKSQAGKRASMAPCGWHHVEGGDGSAITLKTLNKVAAALGIPAKELLM